MNFADFTSDKIITAIELQSKPKFTLTLVLVVLLVNSTVYIMFSHNVFNEGDHTENCLYAPLWEVI